MGRKGGANFRQGGDNRPTSQKRDVGHPSQLSDRARRTGSGSKAFKLKFVVSHIATNEDMGPGLVGGSRSSLS